MNKINWQNKEFRERHSKRVSEMFKKFNAEGKIKGLDWTGRNHKEETKKKIGVKNSISQKGEKNSQYGTCWIHHIEFGNKKIKKIDIENYIDDGWVRGRKIK